MINYSTGEVRHLIENYQLVCGRRDTTLTRISNIFRIADVDSALRFLPDRYYEVILLHGMIGLTMQSTADILNVSKQAVSKRYANALEDMHYLMNTN